VTSIAPLRQSQDAWTASSEKHNLAVQQAQLAQVLALSSLANIDVQVTANGQPVPDAVVNGLADPGPLQVSYPLFFTNAGGGAYRGYFVTDPAVIPLQQAAQKCVSILETVETSCSVAEPVAVGMLGGGCILLAAGIATVNPAAADKVLLSCESVFADVAAVCAIGGQPNLAGACGAIFAVPALFHPGTISLRVSATKNGITGSRTVSTSSSGGTVNIAIELPLPLCSIMSVSTNPVDPAPFQSYVANVVTTCGGAGDSIAMAISGTDGYSDSVTCAATGSCQLAVPGAAEGIVDTVTVTTSSGESRVIQLVF
jgi:hypothetical protein